MKGFTLCGRLGGSIAAPNACVTNNDANIIANKQLFLVIRFISRSSNEKMAFGFPCCISDEISYQQNKFLYCMSQKDIASPKSFFFIFFFFFFLN